MFIYTMICMTELIFFLKYKLKFILKNSCISN